MTPTARTLALLRAEGWEPWVVERWTVKGTGRFLGGRSLFILERRLDLYNFGDIVAMKPGSGFLVIQTTSGSGVSARVAKILAEPRALMWLETGGRIIVHGWRKVLKVKGGKLQVWRPRLVEITAEMFTNGASPQVPPDMDSLSPG